MPRPSFFVSRWTSPYGRSKAALLTAQAAAATLGALRLVLRATSSVAVVVVVSTIAMSVAGVVIARVRVLTAILPCETGACTTAEVVSGPARRRSAEITALAGLTWTIFGNVEPQGSPADLPSMELLDRLLRLFLVSESNERKAPRASRFAILWDVNVHYFANLTEELTKLLVRGGEVEVPYEYLT